MNSYEVLGVTRDSSDREIEISYEDLKRKYDPSFNTSIRAYTKYREVIKAYENIKNEKRRQMYDLKNDKEKTIVHKEYTLFDFKKETIDIEEDIDYNNVEEVDDLVKEDVVIIKNISYLYYILNLKCDVEYIKEVNCDSCFDYVSCPVCGGKGVVYYKEKHVYCPRCHGKGKVSKWCNKCGGDGRYSKKDTVSFYVDDESVVLKNLGNEYYDNSKSDVVVNFNFYDKENIEIFDNDIKVKYNLSKDETINGINKEFYSENGMLRLNIPGFVDDGYEKEIIFNDKKIIFTFYNETFDGKDVEYYLFINKRYRENIIYFNNDYSECSISESEEYFNKLELKDVVTMAGFGEKGKYGGNNGNLVIRCVFNTRKDVLYVKDVNFVETSKLFNVLGGKIGSFNHYGFKGKNSLIKNKYGYYFLSGNSNEKIKLKDYFWFKVVSLLIGLMLPLVSFFIPYSETMFIVLFILLFTYFVFINLIMEVKI